MGLVWIKSPYFGMCKIRMISAAIVEYDYLNNSFASSMALSASLAAFSDGESPLHPVQTLIIMNASITAAILFMAFPLIRISCLTFLYGV